MGLLSYVFLEKKKNPVDEPRHRAARPCQDACHRAARPCQDAFIPWMNHATEPPGHARMQGWGKSSGQNATDLRALLKSRCLYV